jgi:hypothetical protein
MFDDEGYASRCGILSRWSRRSGTLTTGGTTRWSILLLDLLLGNLEATLVAICFCSTKDYEASC